MTVVYVALWVQTFRHKVCGLRPGDTADPGGQKGPRQRLPLAVLRLHHVRTPAEHRRRILLDGGQEARLQAGLRGGQE